MSLAQVLEFLSQSLVEANGVVTVLDVSSVKSAKFEVLRIVADSEAVEDDDQVADDAIEAEHCSRHISNIPDTLPHEHDRRVVEALAVLVESLKECNESVESSSIL